jgi:transposase
MEPVLVGIDVASRSLAVVIERPGQPLVLEEHPNSPAGHRRLVRALTARRNRARVCLEATGIYGFDLAMALHEARGIEVMVANPRAVRDFSRALFERSKTDLVDAVVLVEFLRRMHFEPWRPPAPEILEIRAISRAASRA